MADILGSEGDVFGSAGDFFTGGGDSSSGGGPTTGTQGESFFGMYDVAGSLFQNELNRRAASKQMDFQERMSSTAWQRGVKDMIAAGINPMLAAMKGPASSPEGARAEFVSPTAQGVHSAQAGQMLEVALDKTRAETENVKADTQLKGQEMWRSVAARENIISSTYNLTAEYRNILATLPKIESETERQRAETRLTEISSRLRGLEATHSALDLSRAGAESEAWRGTYGEHIRPYLKDVSQVVSTAASAAAGVAAGRFTARGLSSGARGGASGLRPGGGQGLRVGSPEWRRSVRDNAQRRGRELHD